MICSIMCDDVLIDDFEYMIVECKWQVMTVDIIILICGWFYTHGRNSIITVILVVI